MTGLPPILVLDRFPAERAALLGLLAGLTAQQWSAPTVCPGWSVKDIALHLLGDDLNRLPLSPSPLPAPAATEGWLLELLDERVMLSERVFAGRSTASLAELVPLINEANEAWVASVRRLDPAQVIALLRASGQAVHAQFAMRDPFAIGHPIHWAGPEPAPAWVDIAREYTERWLHQAQIRDAVGAALLTDAETFAPVLDTFVRAFPHTYREIAASEGTRVRLIITGSGGRSWLLARRGGGWALVVDDGATAAGTLTLDQDTAWRLFTKGVTPESARRRAVIDGDEALALPALRMVSILA